MSRQDHTAGGRFSVSAQVCLIPPSQAAGPSPQAQEQKEIGPSRSSNCPLHRKTGDTLPCALNYQLTTP